MDSCPNSIMVLANKNVFHKPSISESNAVEPNNIMNSNAVKFIPPRIKLFSVSNMLQPVNREQFKICVECDRTDLTR